MRQKFGGAITGAVTLASGSLVEQGARMLRNMLLARIMLPEHFGTAALVTSAIGAIQIATELGVRQAVIQQHHTNPHDLLSAAWLLSVIRGVSLALLIYFAAPAIAYFFSLETHVSLFRLGSFVVLADCLASPAMYAAERSMNYTRISLVAAAGALCGIAVSVILAILYREPWTLVVGFAMESLCRCALSYVFFPFRASARASRESWFAILNYSKGMFGLTFLTLVFNRVDVFTIGRLCAKADVGNYVLTASVAYAPFGFLGYALRVLLPVMANSQNDRVRLGNIASLVASFYFFACIPLFFFVLVFGGDILHIILGSRFDHLGVLLAFQLLAQIVYHAGNPIATVFMALGIPHAFRPGAAIRALVAAILVPILVMHWGLIGATVAICISATIGIMEQYRRLQVLVPISSHEIHLGMLRQLLVSATAAGASVILIWTIPLNIELRLSAGIALFVGILATQKIHLRQLLLTARVLRGSDQS